MDPWLRTALDDIPDDLGHPMRVSEQPGCVIAIVRRGRLVLEQACGHADPERDAHRAAKH